jgi:Icc protein
MSHDHNEKYITSELADDGIDRRGFLKCMAWTGTGLLWTLKGGIPTSMALGRLGALDDTARKEIFFAQISDSHIGFSKDANKDVTATLLVAVDRLNALPRTPAFVLHTGDISQLSKAAEFDTADQVLKGIKTDRIFFVPGEHDVLTDNGASYLQRYGAKAKGGGWYSFDHSGVHFIGLVNVLNLKAGGLGSLGPEQLDWLRRDVRGLASSTPIVLFAHIPLWTVYPQWGWGTDDSEQALALLKRFGSLTVLNGHIHQVMQKVEGNVSFHTAMSTAFPQPAPGSAPSPGPMKVDADRLASVLGTTNVTYVQGRHGLAVVDATLSGAPVMATMEHGEMAEKAHASTQRAVPLGPNEVGIDNFAFTPGVLTVKAGTSVTWDNRDDVPHIIVDTRGRFSSKVLDTDQKFTLKLTAAGTYDYFCSIHPKMTGRLVVE